MDRDEEMRELFECLMNIRGDMQCLAGVVQNPDMHLQSGELSKWTDDAIKVRNRFSKFIDDVNTFWRKEE